jgi:DNA-binding ferritin-like protein
MDRIMLKFLYFLNQIKIYHWQTTSFARHKASDELYHTLVDKVDEFMEVIQGSRNERVRLSSIKKIHCQNVSDNGVVKMLNNFRSWLLELELEKNDVGLISIRDDMIASVNKTLYLFTLE